MSKPPIHPPLAHEAAFPEIGALALGGLSAEEESRVRAHARNCAVCTDELAAMESVIPRISAGMPWSSMSEDRSDSIRQRLMARAAAVPVTEPALDKRRDPFRFLAIAASVAAVALGIANYNQYSSRRDLLAGSAERDSVIGALNALVSERNSQLSAITGPSVSVVDLSSTGPRAPTARMFWEKRTNRWTLVAHGLSAPKADRTYELWLVTADRKIPAGIFKPAADGSAIVTATYALNPADLKAIAVTEEPEGGVSAPTGSVILAGTAGG